MLLLQEEQAYNICKIRYVTYKNNTKVREIT